MRFIVLSWSDVRDACTQIANRIVGDGRRFGTIVALSRGGLIPARILSDLLDIGDVRVIGVKYYEGVDRTLSHPTITQPLTQPISLGPSKDNVLFVDEVVDSGRSLLTALRHALPDGVGDTVAIAALCVTERSEPLVDYYALKKVKGRDWFVYPWELVETTKLLLSDGMDIADVRRLLEPIGFDDSVNDLLEVTR